MATFGENIGDMKTRFVISNTPIRLPINSTILYAFLLYYFDVNNIWWGIFITVYSILWIAAISIRMSEESIDLNDKDLSEKKKVVQSRFARKLEELYKKQDK